MNEMIKKLRELTQKLSNSDLDNNNIPIIDHIYIYRGDAWRESAFDSDIFIDCPHCTKRHQLSFNEGKIIHDFLGNLDPRKSPLKMLLSCKHCSKFFILNSEHRTLLKPYK